MMTMMTNAVAAEAAVPFRDFDASVRGVIDLPDPLDDDLPEDEVVVTTRRGLVRVALVAAETGGRFQRERVPHDPMSWMLAPRRLFGGEAALDACLDRDACLRGVLLHGLSLGLDADPEDVDELSDDDGDLQGMPTIDMKLPVASDRSRRLYTTVIDVDRVGGRGALALCAMVAEDRETVRRRLADRHGDWIANGARIVEGIDGCDARVAELASTPFIDFLRGVEADPGSAEADGLDVTVERRFA